MTVGDAAICALLSPNWRIWVSAHIPNRKCLVDEGSITSLVIARYDLRSQEHRGRSVMKIEGSNKIAQLKVIIPDVFYDFRGEYVETFNARRYEFYDDHGQRP